MGSFGRYYTKNKEKEKRMKVLQMLLNKLSYLSPDAYSSMRGRCERVEVMTPRPLFPIHHSFHTVYCVGL